MVPMCAFIETVCLRPKHSCLGNKSLDFHLFTYKVEISIPLTYFSNLVELFVERVMKLCLKCSVSPADIKQMG